jgi:hypothetical protein
MFVLLQDEHSWNRPVDSDISPKSLGLLAAWYSVYASAVPNCLFLSFLPCQPLMPRRMGPGMVCLPNAYLHVYSAFTNMAPLNVCSHGSLIADDWMVSSDVLHVKTSV